MSAVSQPRNAVEPQLVEREMYCPRCRRFLGVLALPASCESGWQRIACPRCGKFVILQVVRGVIRGPERMVD